MLRGANYVSKDVEFVPCNKIGSFRQTLLQHLDTLFAILAHLLTACEKFYKRPKELKYWRK